MNIDKMKTYEKLPPFSFVLPRCSPLASPLPLNSCLIICCDVGLKLENRKLPCRPKVSNVP